MKKVLILVCLALLFFGCSKKDDGKVLVTIDGDTVTLEEFNKELDRIPANMKMLVLTESGKRSFLDRYVIKRLLLREAKKENIEKEKEFEDSLSEIREQLLIQSLLKKKVTMNINTTEEELKKYYEANKDKFKTGPEIETRQIAVKTEKEAKEIKARLDKGEDFAELARTYSIDPSAKTSGGAIGSHGKGSLPPEYEAAAFKLTKAGQISQPVKIQQTYYIIQLTGIKEAGYTPFEEVKEFIKQRIVQERQNEVLEKYVTELKKGAKIEVSEELLKEEGKKGEAPAAAPQPGKVEPSGKVSETPIKGEPAPKSEAAPKK
ncbi:MAG: peptidylprolyl isomerase [Deltaproteobacteria bacterium]|nr:peptidylprolyl isomerase [Deltaproteobacteria bacterium]